MSVGTGTTLGAALALGPTDGLDAGVEVGLELSVGPAVTVGGRDDPGVDWAVGNDVGGGVRRGPGAPGAALITGIPDGVPPRPDTRLGSMTRPIVGPIVGIRPEGPSTALPEADTDELAIDVAPATSFRAPPLSDNSTTRTNPSVPSTNAETSRHSAPRRGTLPPSAAGSVVR